MRVACRSAPPPGFCRPCAARRPPISVAARAHAVAASATGAQPQSFFVATNNFKVKPEHAEAFETMWRTRESRLNDCPGFIRFALLKCEEPAGEYVSQTYWQRREDFDNWTKSQNFSKAHSGVSKKPEESGGGSKKPSTMEMLEGPPKVKLFSTVTVTEREA